MHLIIEEDLFDNTEAERHELEKERHEAHRRCHKRWTKIKPVDRTEPTTEFGRGLERLRVRLSRDNKRQRREKLQSFEPVDDTPIITFMPPAPDEVDIDPDRLIDLSDVFEDLADGTSVPDTWMMHEVAVA